MSGFGTRCPALGAKSVNEMHRALPRGLRLEADCGLSSDARVVPATHAYLLKTKPRAVVAPLLMLGTLER